ncbi:MAG: hypothetical protein OYG32_04965 [Rhodospirillaceae bacterium]|nr:hypothetical protein [Rhodospirillaceae bacterium]
MQASLSAVPPLPAADERDSEGPEPGLSQDSLRGEDLFWLRVGAEAALAVYMLAGNDLAMSAPAASATPTFDEAAASFIALQTPGWKNGGKSAFQWQYSLDQYASPALGSKRIDEIEPAHVAAAVLPIWGTKRETATRVKRRIGARHLLGASPRGKELADATMSKLLRSLGIDAIPHGFRSSFRDWASEVEGAEREVAEIALAHMPLRRSRSGLRPLRPARAPPRPDAELARLPRTGQADSGLVFRFGEGERNWKKGTRPATRRSNDCSESPRSCG